MTCRGFPMTRSTFIIALPLPVRRIACFPPSIG